MTGPSSAGSPRLYLIGLMGSGKSTVGRKLAATLGRPYLDNDAIIATLAGRSTVALAELGGTVLHDWESHYVQYLAADQPVPFVAGIAASTADRPADLATLRRSGMLVYLRSAPDVLAGRIDRDQPRPWITGGSAALIERMYRRRDPVLSAECDVVVDATAAPDQVRDGILAALAEPGAPP